MTTTRRPIAARAAGLLGLVLLAGCVNVAQSLEGEVVSSMQYDRMPCQQLVADRDALAARHGEPSTLDETQKPGARPAYVAVGLGTALPDARGADVKERRRALGQIEAMDHSIERRDCRGDGRGKRRGPL